MQLLDLLDRGAPLKLAASELGISQTRVNQIVRDLKERLGAQSRFDLVQIYRAQSDVRLTYTKDAYPKYALPVDGSSANSGPGTTAGKFVFSDIQSFTIEAPWEEQTADPSVVPEMLDGPNAKGLRLIAMVLMLVLIVITITFAAVTTMTVTELWSEWGSISSEKRGHAE